MGEFLYFYPLIRVVKNFYAAEKKEKTFLCIRYHQCNRFYEGMIFKKFFYGCNKICLLFINCMKGDTLCCLFV